MISSWLCPALSIMALPSGLLLRRNLLLVISEAQTLLCDAMYHSYHILTRHAVHSTLIFAEPAFALLCVVWVSEITYKWTWFRGKCPNFAMQLEVWAEGRRHVALLNSDSIAAHTSEGWFFLIDGKRDIHIIRQYCLMFSGIVGIAKISSY